MSSVPSAESARMPPATIKVLRYGAGSARVVALSAAMKPGSTPPTKLPAKPANDQAAVFSANARCLYSVSTTLIKYGKPFTKKKEKPTSISA